MPDLKREPILIDSTPIRAIRRDPRASIVQFMKSLPASLSLTRGDLILDSRPDTSRT
jgi:hypothetical protein